MAFKLDQTRMNVRVDQTLMNVRINQSINLVQSLTGSNQNIGNDTCIVQLDNNYNKLLLFLESEH
jgi:hypothetical protein